MYVQSAPAVKCTSAKCTICITARKLHTQLNNRTVVSIICTSDKRTIRFCARTLALQLQSANANLVRLSVMPATPMMLMTFVHRRSPRQSRVYVRCVLIWKPSATKTMDPFTNWVINSMVSIVRTVCRRQWEIIFTPFKLSVRRTPTRTYRLQYRLSWRELNQLISRRHVSLIETLWLALSLWVREGSDCMQRPLGLWAATVKCTLRLNAHFSLGPRPCTYM